ncbi:GL14785 [Drosophila persimilis]|uniref:GL14785 n=1 Tax=Drosophila persimilis TaxID=7234 RepID=B4GQ47_DROPE|nr:GL14785 [Drosophila persimilis]
MKLGKGNAREPRNYRDFNLRSKPADSHLRLFATFCQDQDHDQDQDESKLNAIKLNAAQRLPDDDDDDDGDGETTIGRRDFRSEGTKAVAGAGAK